MTAFLNAVPAAVFALVCVIAVVSTTVAVVALRTRPERPQPQAPAPPPAPPLTEDEHGALADLSVRRRFAAPQDTTNARLLADEWRQAAPGVDDATLGRLALAAYGTATAAWIGSPSGTWAMARVTKMLGFAAVELTELERSDVPQ